MSILSERLRSLRQSRGLSQNDLSRQLGISKSTVNMYERGDRRPSFEMTETIADYFNVDMTYLSGKQDVERIIDVPSQIPNGFQPLPAAAQVPLVGRIACGQPITAEENIEGRVSLPQMWKADFALTCSGDSMEPRIHDGDLVAIRKQPMVENGEIAAVRIGCEATLKHVYLSSDRIVLQPENPNYAPIVKIGAEMNDVTIEGKAVGLCRGL